MDQSERQELLSVIGDFIEMGHVENIVAMFKQDPGLYSLAGDLLRDDRFVVRLGMSVLFEELAKQRPHEIAFAIPSLLPLLADPTPYIRGEAVSLLGLIATPEALTAVAPLAGDPDPQVAEIARDIMQPNLAIPR